MCHHWLKYSCLGAFRLFPRRIKLFSTFRTFGYWFGCFQGQNQRPALAVLLISTVSFIYQWAPEWRIVWAPEQWQGAGGPGAELPSLGRESEVGMPPPELPSHAAASDRLCFSGSVEECCAGQRKNLAVLDFTWWAFPQNGNGGWMGTSRGKKQNKARCLLQMYFSRRLI